MAWLAIVGLVPVCLTLWMGGADWTIRDAVHLSWYQGWVAWPLLAALIGWLILTSGIPVAAESSSPTGEGATTRSRLAQGLTVLGLSFAVAAVCLFWTGGFGLFNLSISRPELGAWSAIGLLSIAGSLLSREALHRGVLSARAPSFLSRRAGGIAVGIALSLGVLIQYSLGALDAHSMTRSLEKPVQAAPPGSAFLERPDLVWIVVDTLRADALGVYAPGPGSSHTPFLDSLGNRGVLFERALAPAPWTVPSMFSAFTALWPSSLDPEGRGRARRADERIGLNPAVPTWIDRLRESGYYTAGFQKNPFLGEDSGLEERFDVYRMVGGDRAEGESASQLVNAALRWGDAVAEPLSRQSAPYLLYLHFMDPHIDYAPPAAWLPSTTSETDERAATIDGRARTLHRRLAEGPRISASETAQLARLYGGEVAYLDSELARLWSGLAKRGLVDADTLVVVTGDHGEQFGEHGGWEHGDLYAENVHVPFLIAGGGVERKPRRISESVSLLDLGPTLLERLGLPALSGAEGRALLEEGRPDEGAADRAIPSEYGARARLEWGRWVLIEGRGEAPSAALYDRRADPKEKVDLAAKLPEVAARLRAGLAAHRSRDHDRRERVRSASEDLKLEAELRALGYGASSE